MSDEAAGQVNIVLSVNQANFSQAMANAQRQLDALAGKGKAAGHSTVSSMQAASASIRLMENPLGNNIRAIERLASQSKILSGVFKAAFPLVGVIGIGMAIGKLGADVVAFVQKVNGMPKAITDGFNALNLASRTTNDELDLTNAKLQNEIAKLEGKPQNNLKVEIAETRVEADKLAESLANDAKSINDLVTSKKVGALGILLGQAPTASVSSSIQSYMNDLQALGNSLSDATQKGDTKLADSIKQQIKAKQDSGLAWAKSKLFVLDNPQFAGPDDDVLKGADQGSGRAMLLGFQGALLNEEHHQTSSDTNTQLEGEKAKAEQRKAAAQAALEAQKKAAAAQLAQWEEDNSDWKAAEDRSLRDDAAWWQAKLDTLTKGSANYRAVSKKVNADIIADNREWAKLIADYTTEFMNEGNKRSWVSPEDTETINANGKAVVEWITALRAGMDLTRENSDAMAESSTQMALATGNMTKLDAAQAQANLHAEQYRRTMEALNDSRQMVLDDSSLSDMERRAQLAQVDNAIASVQGKRDLQAAQDRQATNPSGSSAGVGFVDALDEFVIATRDAASQMRDIAMSSLSTVNGEIVKAMSGQKTSFGNAGASIFRNIANTGLQKAEGSVLGAFGFGSSKADGSKGNPLYVRIADSLSGAVSSASSTIGGKTGSFIGTILDMLPKFADGGAVSSNMLSIVGERGPELFMPSTAGRVIPNNQLASLGGGSGDIHISVDARGSSDPAQVNTQVAKALQYALPHFVAASQQPKAETRRRVPATKQ